MKNYNRTFVNPLLAMAFKEGVEWINDDDIECLEPYKDEQEKVWVIEILDHREDDTDESDEAVECEDKTDDAEEIIEKPVKITAPVSTVSNNPATPYMNKYCIECGKDSPTKYCAIQCYEAAENRRKAIGKSCSCCGKPATRWDQKLNTYVCGKDECFATVADPKPKVEPKQETSFKTACKQCNMGDGSVKWDSILRAWVCEKKQCHTALMVKSLMAKNSTTDTDTQDQQKVNCGQMPKRCIWCKSENITSSTLTNKYDCESCGECFQQL